MDKLYYNSPPLHEIPRSIWRLELNKSFLLHSSLYYYSPPLREVPRSIWRLELNKSLLLHSSQQLGVVNRQGQCSPIVQRFLFFAGAYVFLRESVSGSNLVGLVIFLEF